jgi:hypothetical protein
MFPVPQSRLLGHPAHPLFNDVVLLSPTQDRSMAGTSLPQNPSSWQGAFKPCSTLRRHIRHRHHPRQMRQPHPVLRVQKPPVQPGGSMPPGDSRFLALLSNPNVMSGSLDKGRQSVFAILDRLRRPSAHGTEAPASRSAARKEPGSAGWFDTLKKKVVVGGRLVSDKATEGTKSLKANAGEGWKIVKTKTRWAPSRDKISFQATWWGYRLYVFIPMFTCQTGVDLIIVSGTCLRLFWMC